MPHFFTILTTFIATLLIIVALITIYTHAQNVVETSLAEYEYFINH